MTIKLVSGYLFLLAVTTAPLVAQQSAAESKPVTRTGTIVDIDKTNRIVTLRNAQEAKIAVRAPEQMEGFDSLKVGDQVSATYFEATVVRVRKPGDPAASPDPQTTVTRKDRTAGSEIRREQTYTVRIESLDMRSRHRGDDRDVRRPGNRSRQLRARPAGGAGEADANWWHRSSLSRSPGPAAASAAC